MGVFSRIAAIVAGSLLPLGAGGLAVAAPAVAAPLELAPCELAAAEGRIEVAAQCGALSVPVDWDASAGGRLDLAVAVVSSLAKQPLPDPLVVVAGGPGQAATEFFATSRGAFRQILSERDVLLVDQRGTGTSAPLNCAGVEALGPGGPAANDEADWIAAWIDAVAGCVDELPHDPRFFTTSVAVRDLDAVRAALGYERLNIYGVSYGTRVAQHYLRRYPSRVRTLILDGAVPPTLALGLEVAPASQAALDSLLERCQAEAACQAAFPELASQFAALLERLDAAPAEATFDHPRTGEATTAPLNRYALAGVTRFMIYSPRTAALWPPAIAAAHAGDYAALAALATLIPESIGTLATGLNYVVLCTEDVPHWGEVDWAQQAASYMGTAFAEVLEGVCRRRPAGVMDDDFKEPLASDAPVLLLSGELDPVTPPRYAELAAAGLGDAVHVVGRGQGHGMVLLPCMQRIMADFVADGATGGLDLACVERIEAAPLFASKLGPGP